MNNIVHQMGSRVRYVYVQYGERTTAAFTKMRFDHNCYAADFNDYAGLSMRAWRDMGQDINTFIGNPRFRDIQGADFRLSPDSRVRASGQRPGRDVLGLLGQGTNAPINMGAYIAGDDSDIVGIRPRPLTDRLPLNWTWPYA
jgi:hypothetical protein